MTRSQLFSLLSLFGEACTEPATRHTLLRELTSTQLVTISPWEPRTAHLDLSAMS